jgi:serine/threonine protein kinase
MSLRDDVTQEISDHSNSSQKLEFSTHPARIGRYAILRVLGQGGFGRVYLAQDDQLDRLVSVKVPHVRLITSATDAEAYLTEARNVANLDHPFIVPVFDVGSTESFPCYIVSKYIKGTNGYSLAGARVMQRF